MFFAFYKHILGIQSVFTYFKRLFWVPKEVSFFFQRLGHGADLVQLDQDGVAGTQLDALGDRKSTRLNSSHVRTSRMPSSA